MRSSIFSGAVMLFTLVALSGTPMFAADSDHAKDEQEIRARGKAFIAAWAKHDAKALAAFYTPDGDIITANGDAMNGRDDIEQHLSDAFEGALKDTTLTDTIQKIRFIKPDVAIVDSEMEIRADPTTEGNKFHAISVLVKRDGKWLTETARAVVYAQQ